MIDQGTAWGFTDDREAVSHPMTGEEWGQWFNENQATSIIAGIVDNVGHGLDEILRIFDRLEQFDREKEVLPLDKVYNVW